MVMPHQMPAAFFLLCVALATAPGVTWAEVVKDFEKCKNFFFEGIEPKGLDKNYVKICQKQGGTYHYATLYSSEHRIPLYSAYTYDPLCSGNTDRNFKFWFVEPQINSSKSSPEMGHMVLTQLEESQAVDMDYMFTGMERGQLKPSTYQCNKTDLSTFTLTNAVPLDPAFSNVYWRSWQDNLKSILKAYALGGTIYIVTGALPSDLHIPIPNTTTTGHSRVSVPSHIWTAVCFWHSKDSTKSFSFSFAGRNGNRNNIRAMTIEELNEKVGRYRENSRITVFSDQCPGNKELSEEIMQTLSAESSKFEGIKIIDRLREEGLTALTNDIIFARKNKAEKTYPKVHNLDVVINVIDKTNDRSEWFDKHETMKKAGIACVKTKESESQQKGLSEFSCMLQPEKSMPRSVLTVDTTYCKTGEVCHTVCYTEDGEKNCCTTPCLYNKKSHNFMCYSGTNHVSCTPQYSVTTHNNIPCKKNHQCGSFGQKYYWCYTESNWDYCSSPFMRAVTVTVKRCRGNHACGTYGKTYHWCYTDYEDNWENCCLGDDPYSAVNGRTCRSDHPCGNYGQSYKWCYTTDNTWDYCCTPA